MKKIYTFRPYPKTTIWGGCALVDLKGLPAHLKNVGETWEISSIPGHESLTDSGEPLSALIRRLKGALVGRKVYEKYGDTFPLLIKYIDAAANLSVQVHPDDQMARTRHGCPGKTELWYIMRTAPGATITAGLTHKIDKEDYKKLVANGQILNVLASHQSAPGDVFFLPPGRIHTIGAGNLLLEIQQASDITYRVYDYNRRDAQGSPRQLHTEEAADAIDYTVYPRYRTEYDRNAPGPTPLVHCQYFNVDKIAIPGQSTEIPLPADSFLTLSCVSGSGTITADTDKATVKAGDTLLIAASTTRLTATGSLTLIAAYISQ